MVFGIGTLRVIFGGAVRTQHRSIQEEGEGWNNACMVWTLVPKIDSARQARLDDRGRERVSKSEEGVR